MIDFSKLTYNGLTSTRKDLKFAYLGKMNHSAKFSFNKGFAIYSIYLASADLSGYNVCPNHKHCKKHCLVTSGRTRMELSKGEQKTLNTRIKKTKLFFENKDVFMKMLIDEIKLNKIIAEIDNQEFSVRLNATSDIDIEQFTYEGKNILEIFPNVQFYNYTKVFKYLENQKNKQYPNYDLTYSFNGFNWIGCLKSLKMGFRVAVVFEKVPVIFDGIPVINGDDYDARYKDDKNVIVGLKFKQNENSVVNNKFTIPDTPFVIKKDDARCTY